jgi:hypothetical protein
VELAKGAFCVRPLPGGTRDLPAALDALTRAAARGVAFLVAGGGEAHLLTEPDPVQAEAVMPPGRSPRWRGLAASVLQELLLTRVWGISDDEQSVRIVHHDAAAAVRAADSAPGGTAVICTALSATVILSTTTSTQDSGLLDLLVPMFERQSGLTVKTISVGTGQALALAARQNGIELYNYQAPNGASLARSVDFLVPYCEGRKSHAEWVHSKVKFDRERAEAGEKGFIVGAAFDPREARRVLELAAFFEPGLLPLLARLSSAPAASNAPPRYPTWQTVLNEARKSP